MVTLGTQALGAQATASRPARDVASSTEPVSAMATGASSPWPPSEVGNLFVRIPARLNGPPGTGNGGWVAGTVASFLRSGPAEVTLWAPTPLDVPLRCEWEPETARLYPSARDAGEDGGVARAAAPAGDGGTGAAGGGDGGTGAGGGDGGTGAAGGGDGGTGAAGGGGTGAGGGDGGARVGSGAGSSRGRGGRTVLVEARAVDYSPVPPPFIDVDVATRAQAAFIGNHNHPFPGCVVCGVHRAPGDGMRIHTGPVPGMPGVVAGLWTVSETFAGPDGRVPKAAIWGSLDCPTAWAHLTGDDAALLGRITVSVVGSVVPGATYVVVARAEGTDGRKAFAHAGLYDTGGAIVATSRAIWIKVPSPNQQSI